MHTKFTIGCSIVSTPLWRCCSRGRCRAISLHIPTRRRPTAGNDMKSHCGLLMFVSNSRSLFRKKNFETEGIKSFCNECFEITDTSYYARTGVIIDVWKQVSRIRLKAVYSVAVTHSNTNQRNLTRDDNPPEKETGLDSRWRRSYRRTGQTKRL